MKKNSVLGELRVERLEATQEEICCRALWSVMIECIIGRMKGKGQLCIIGIQIMIIKK